MTQPYRWYSRFIGPKSFYKKTARLAVPMSLQQCLTGSMEIIDTLMVSWIGQVTAVGTAAQIDMMCHTITYGALSGTNMFSSQFYGAKDFANLKRTFGLSLILMLINAVFWLGIVLLFGDQILRFYINDESVVRVSSQYLHIAMFSLIPSGFSFAFSFIYRSTQKAAIALKISICSMILNVLFNSLLIFGFGPFPQLGVRGAALGTLLAQCCSLMIILTHAILTKQPFLGTPKEMFNLPWNFVSPILKKTYPLVINEAFFSLGSTLFVKAFGTLGKSSMDAYYIGNQVFNLFQFFIYGYGTAQSVLLGSSLGQGKIEDARREGDYYIGLCAVLSIILVVLMVLFTKPLVAVFNPATPEIYQTTIWVTRAFAVKVSLRLFNFMILSTLRSGGDSKIITLLDSGIMWLIGIPLAFFLVNVLHLTDIAQVFLIVQVEQLVRLIFGLRRFEQGCWARDLTTLVEAELK